MPKPKHWLTFSSVIHDISHGFSSSGGKWAPVWCCNRIQTPHPGEAGSPCVFLDIYRVSPARLSDCIYLYGALLVHTSHPPDSSFFKHTGHARHSSCWGQLLLVCVCVCLSLCDVQCSGCAGKCQAAGKSLAFEPFWVATSLCLTVSKRACWPIVISHLAFSTGTSEVKLSQSVAPLNPCKVKDASAGPPLRARSSLLLSAFSSGTPGLLLTQWDVCQLFSTPQLFSQPSSVAAGHQFVDKSPFLNSSSRSISQGWDALRNDWWSEAIRCPVPLPVVRIYPL